MAPLEPRDEHHLLLLLDFRRIDAMHVRYNSLDSLACLFACGTEYNARM
jgi:hypothetical protein